MSCLTAAPRSLTLSGERVRAITRFVDNGVLPYFGLPRTLPA